MALIREFASQSIHGDIVAWQLAWLFLVGFRYCSISIHRRLWAMS